VKFLALALAEQYLWRATNLTIVLSPSISVAVITALPQRDGLGAKVFFLGFLALHSLAHLYLLVDVFASLRWQPADLYKSVDWAAYFPRINQRKYLPV